MTHIINKTLLQRKNREKESISLLSFCIVQLNPKKLKLKQLKTNMETKNYNPKEELYKWATIVMEEENKTHETGEIKFITIIDSYGTVININIE